MPIAQQDYAALKGLFNGSPMLQVTSLAINTESGLQPVQLLHEGIGGYTTGSGSVTIEVGFVVPIGGQEFDFQGVCARGEFCTLQVFVGRQSYSGKGKINTVNITQSVDQVASGTFTFTGPKKAME
jgi:hypothetical protein